MPNGFEAFAQNAIALGDRWREQRKEKKLSRALVNFDQDPAGTIAGVTKVDPVIGWNMRRQVQQDVTAAQEAQRAKATDALKMVTGLLGPAAMEPGATPESLGAAYDSLLPILTDGLGMNPEEIVKWKQMIIANPGILRDIDQKLQVVAPGSAVVQGNREVYRNPYPDQVMAVGSDATGRRVITVPRTYGGASQGQPTAEGGPAPAAASGPAPSAQPANVEAGWDFTQKHEGGYAPSDANGAPVNFGVNQASYRPRPGWPKNVKDLTKEQAKQIYIEDYWNPSGAANLPGPLATIHADTYYINPSRAAEFLQASGGDPNRYLQLRQSWHNRLVEKDPKKYGRYAKAWRNRVNDLQATLASGGGVVGGGGGAPQGGSAAGPGGARTVFETPPVQKVAAAGADGSVLTWEEVEELSLSPSVRWQRVKGEIKPIGGANYLNKVMKQDQAYDSIKAKTIRMEEAARALLTHPGITRAAGVNSYIPSLRGGDAYDFEKKLEAVKSQIGFTILDEMRQMSPTGGALGNVSNFEVETLQKNIDALDLGQSPQQLKANIQRIADYSKSLRARYDRAWRIDRRNGTKKEGGGGGSAPASSAAIPRAAQDMLRKNPSPQRRQQFDAIFGPGAAKRVLGGQ